jgi:MraZ protein
VGLSVGYVALFIGTFYHNLDAKNRVTVPRKILEKAVSNGRSSKFYVSMGMEDCLFLFTEKRWEELTQSLDSVSLGKLEARDFQRLFFSDTYEVDVDGSGRILIPDVLKSSAGLTREVVFLGAGSRVEIWDAERWKTRKSKIAGGYATIASEII